MEKSLFGSKILFLNQPKGFQKQLKWKEKLKYLKEKSKEKQGFQI